MGASASLTGGGGEDAFIFSDCCEWRSAEYNRAQSIVEPAPRESPAQNLVVVSIQSSESSVNGNRRRGISLPVHPSPSNGGREKLASNQETDQRFPDQSLQSLVSNIRSVSDLSNSGDPRTLLPSQPIMSPPAWSNQSILDVIDPADVSNVNTKTGRHSNHDPVTIPVSPLKPHSEAKIDLARWLLERDREMQKRRRKTVETADDVSRTLLSDDVSRKVSGPAKCYTKAAIQFRASDLAAKDTSLWHGRSSDPYLLFSQNGRVLGRTQTVMHSRNPIWKPVELEFESDEKSLVRIAAYDWDRFTSDDLIGTEDVRASDLLTLNTCFYLQHGGKITGKC